MDHSQKLKAAFEIQDMCIFPASVLSAGIKYVVDPVKYWKYISQWTKPEPVIKFSQFTMKLLLTFFHKQMNHLLEEK